MFTFEIHNFTKFITLSLYQFWTYFPYPVSVGTKHFSMEEVLVRFFHLGQQIFGRIDDQSFVKCRQVCPYWKMCIVNCSVATFATGSALVHENNLHLYNDKYLMYHLMNFMLKGVKSIPNDRYLMEVKTWKGLFFLVQSGKIPMCEIIIVV